MSSVSPQSVFFLRRRRKLRKIHRTNSLLHSNIHMNKKALFSTINTCFNWLKRKTEVEYTLCKSHTTILFRHWVSLLMCNPLCGITYITEFPKQCESNELDMWKVLTRWKIIGHFRTAFGLFFKVSTGVYILIWNLVFMKGKALLGNKQILAGEFCVVAAELSNFRCQMNTPRSTNFHIEGWAPGLDSNKMPKVIRNGLLNISEGWWWILSLRQKHIGSCILSLLRAI